MGCRELDSQRDNYAAFIYTHIRLPTQIVFLSGQKKHWLTICGCELEEGVSLSR